MISWRIWLQTVVNTDVSALSVKVLRSALPTLLNWLTTMWTWRQVGLNLIKYIFLLCIAAEDVNTVECCPLRSEPDRSVRLGIASIDPARSLQSLSVPPLAGPTSFVSGLSKASLLAAAAFPLKPSAQCDHVSFCCSLNSELILTRCSLSSPEKTPNRPYSGFPVVLHWWSPLCWSHLAFLLAVKWTEASVNNRLGCSGLCVCEWVSVCVCLSGGCS